MSDSLLGVTQRLLYNAKLDAMYCIYANKNRNRNMKKKDFHHSHGIKTIDIHRNKIEIYSHEWHFRQYHILLMG